MLSKIRFRYVQLYASLLSFEDQILTSSSFDELISIITDEFKKISPETLKEVLIYLVGQKLDKNILRRCSWWIAANYNSLIKNDASPPKTIPDEGQSYLFQILKCFLNGDFVNLEIIALSGSIAGTEFVLSRVDLTKLMRKLYKKLKVPIPVYRYDLFDGLLFRGKLIAMPGFVKLNYDEITCPPFCSKENKRILDARLSLRQSAELCILGGYTLCRNCSKRCDGRPFYYIN